MQVNTEHLLTIKNYALKQKVTASYIYKLEKEKKMQLVVIDGVKFVNLNTYPAIPKKS